MEKIKRSERLPPEFNLKKYDDIPNLSPEEWSLNLHERALIVYELQHRYVDTQNPEYGFGLLRNNDSSNKGFIDESKKYSKAELTNLINTNAVKLLNIRESIEIRNTVEYCNYLKNAIFFPNDSNIDLNQALEFYEERPLFTGGESIAITIDILASDEQLIQDLKAFVTKYRRILKIQPPSPLIVPDEKNIRDWTRWRIIQFLDLQIWELENHKKISYQLLGDILFPPEEDGSSPSERIRKTIAPNSKKLINAINKYYNQIGDRDEQSWLSINELRFRGEHKHKSGN